MTEPYMCAECFSPLEVTDYYNKATKILERRVTPCPTCIFLIQQNLEGKIKDLEDQVSDLENENEDLEDQVSQLEGELASIEKKKG